MVASSRASASRGRSAISPPPCLAQPSTTARAPADVFKAPYILDFLGLADTYSERDLEAAILRNIERFLLELGGDFCFVARQRRLTIDGEDYHIDLVFYHRSLRCLVLVDLKLRAFAPADAAQMQLYLEWSKRHDRRDGEEESIGLILCGSRGEEGVELLLSSQKNRMKVVQYLLPEDTAALKARLAQVTAAYEELHEGATGAEPDAPSPDRVGEGVRQRQGQQERGVGDQLRLLAGEHDPPA